MVVLKSIAMAFLMFSRIPMPRVRYGGDGMKLALAFMPLVGAVIGAVVIGWMYLCEALNVSALLYAAGLALIPVAVTGGIHLDGMCDVTDALASHGDLQKKRSILKDPHCGAFAVIGVCAYMLLYVALCAELPREGVFAIACAHIVSRVCAGAYAVLAAPAQGEGMGNAFRSGAHAKWSLCILALFGALAALGFALANAVGGAAVALCAAVTCALVAVMAKKQFGGMSGDVAGYMVQLIELIAVGSLVIVDKAVALWF
ncbi:MAG: adenosylcobinamide-GDP ribazoletransferase [Clostridia bacterium]|nr:adenosylcobinamide-GDP ribazoletransferase [Clostridia bacterium]